MTKLNNRKSKHPITHDQWIEIETVDGKTVVKYYPPNEQFEKERLDLDPPAQLIYRRIHFVNGVPAEYLWTDPPEQIRNHGGLILHRLTPDLWATVLSRERNQNHTQVLAPDYYIKRPEAFGPCPCDRCTAERENPAA